MKTWKVYEFGLEHPRAEFIRQLNGSRYHFISGCLFDESNSSAKYVRANEEWELVREPVPWQGAIQAWIDGKDIYVEFGGKIYSSFKHPECMYMHDISKSELQDGKWFIAPDGEEMGK